MQIMNGTCSQQTLLIGQLMQPKLVKVVKNMNSGNVQSALIITNADGLKNSYSMIQRGRDNHNNEQIRQGGGV